MFYCSALIGVEVAEKVNGLRHNCAKERPVVSMNYPTVRRMGFPTSQETASNKTEILPG